MGPGLKVKSHQVLAMLSDDLTAADAFLKNVKRSANDSLVVNVVQARAPRNDLNERI